MNYNIVLPLLHNATYRDIGALNFLSLSCICLLIFFKGIHVSIRVRETEDH